MPLFFVSFIIVATGLLALDGAIIVPLCLCAVSAGAAYRPVVFMPILLGGALAVLHVGMAQQTLIATALPQALWQRPMPIVIDIDTVLYDNVRSQSVIATVKSIHAKPFPTRLKLSRYHYSARFTPGDRCHAWVKLKPIHGYSNPGGRNAQDTWMARGITAQGYVIEKKPIHCKRSQAWRVQLHQYRTHAAGVIRDHIKDPAIQQLLTALAVGDKKLDESVQSILQKTGTSHLLAISGLHVGLVGMILFWIMRPIATLLVLCKIMTSSRPMSLVCALIGAVFYIVLTGSAVSSQRAGWMYAFAVLIFLCKKSTAKIALLCCVMFLMILLNAFVVLDIGFWLSSSMVCILIVLSGYCIRPKQGLLGALTLQYQLSWVAFPLTLLLLNQGSLIAPLANMIAIPVVSFAVVPLLLLFDVFVSFSSTCAGWALSAAAYIMTLLWQLLSLSERLPVLWQQPLPGQGMGICLLLSAALLLVPRMIWIRGLGIYFLCVLLVYEPKKPSTGEAWITWLDVGQGLSTVVQTKHHVLVYDTGPQYDDFDVAQLTLIPFLRYEHIHTIDKLMISHADHDHRGGIPALLTQFDVKAMVVGQPLPDIARAQQSCHHNASWDWDGVHFEQWHVRGNWTNSNNHSCVLKITAGKHAVLLLGDLERDGEWALLRNPLRLPSTILSVPHHGSKTSSTQSFLDAVKPRYAIFSAGFLNSYHHPHPSVVSRYDALHVKQLDTGQVGSIRVTLTGRDDIGIECHKDKKC